jgi:hypothetical protein
MQVQASAAGIQIGLGRIEHGFRHFHCSPALIALVLANRPRICDIRVDGELVFAVFPFSLPLIHQRLGFRHLRRCFAVVDEK